MSTIELGCIAKDKITGFEGVVTAKTVYINNCPRFTLKPEKLHEGKPIDSHSFDEGAVIFVKKGKIAALPIPALAEPPSLGDVVRCKITCFTGVATEITSWLEGCSVVTVQPTKLKDGKPAEPRAFDARMVEITKRANPKPAAIKTGGPRPEPRRR